MRVFSEQCAPHPPGAPRHMTLSSIVNPSALFSLFGQSGNSVQGAGQTPGSAGSVSAPDNRAFRIQSDALLALSQLGVSGATNATFATSGATAATPASTAGSANAASGAAVSGQFDADAVQSFLQNLYAALQAQATADTAQAAAGGTNKSSAGSASSTSASSSVHGHHHGHGHQGHGGAGVANLAEQLSSSVAAGSTSTTDGASPLAGSSSSAVSALQQSFNN